jgi:general secretion pathway protein A
MYERFFGFRERPFELVSDPRYLLLTPSHREALSNLEYGISARKAITVLTGEAGTGKTTLVRYVLRNVAASVPSAGRFVQLSNPRLKTDDFIEYLASAFGLPAPAASSKARFLIELEQVLLEHRAANQPTALIVDEAQTLPADLLEEIRLLVNLESDTEKLLPVVLVGQPELADRLNAHDQRQLKQRVALRCHLQPLDLQQTASYIATRVSLAGGDPAQTFTRDAVLAIHRCARGIPRTINVLCDNVLVTGCALSRRPADASLVAAVARDFDLDPGAAPDETAPVALEPAAADGAPAADERAVPPSPTPIGTRRPWLGGTSSSR